MLKGASRLETCKPRGLRRGLHQEQTIMPALGQCFLILVDPSCLVFLFRVRQCQTGISLTAQDKVHFCIFWQILDVFG